MFQNLVETFCVLNCGQKLIFVCLEESIEFKQLKKLLLSII